MVIVLNSTLLKPINRILEERERRIKGRQLKAQKALIMIDEKLREYDRRLRQARAEGYALMEEERIELARRREEKVSEVKAELSSWLQTQKERVKNDAARVRARLRLEAPSMALEISRRILHRDVTEDR
jgi:F-type H+-transporting ATPase subunit b